MSKKDFSNILTLPTCHKVQKHGTMTIDCCTKFDRKLLHTVYNTFVYTNRLDIELEFMNGCLFSFAEIPPINMKKGGPRTSLFNLCKTLQWPMPTINPLETKSKYAKQTFLFLCILCIQHSA